MPMFYFHVRRGDHLFVDAEGARLTGLPKAWDHAVDDAHLVARHFHGEREPSEQWIEIGDPKGSILAVVRFGRAIH